MKSVYVNSRGELAEWNPHGPAKQYFYAYDADGDSMVDENGEPDCCDLGGFEALNMEAAILEARRIWPGTKNIRVA